MPIVMPNVLDNTVLQTALISYVIAVEHHIEVNHLIQLVILPVLDKIEEL